MDLQWLQKVTFSYALVAKYIIWTCRGSRKWQFVLQVLQKVSLCLSGDVEG